jgi:hypothetical protein
MKRTIPIVLAAAVLGLAGWWMLSPYESQTSTEKGIPDRLVGALPPPQPGNSGVAGISKKAARDIDLSLDRIVGASTQQVSDLLAGRTPQEIALLVQQLDGLKPGGLSNAKIDLIFKAWAQLASQDALKAALSFHNAWAKTRALESIFDETSPDAAASLVASLNQTGDGAIPLSLKQELIGKGVSKWSETDPAGAAKFLDAQSNLQLGPATWRQVAENWAAQDPKSALDWVQMQSTDISRVAMQGIVSGWLQKDPQAAQDYCASHVDNLAGQQSASIVANRMAATDPERAAKWASQLPNENARQMSELTVAGGWAANDPRNAAQWAASLPADDQEGALSAIASVWAESDPQAAGEWLNTLSGSGRDAAVASYASALAPVDPATALAWALSASNSSIREEVASRIANDWLMRDPSAARTWIQQSTLSDVDKAQLLGTSTAAE